MADGKPPGVSDEEWAAITAHREANAPKRKGFLRGTEGGVDFEIELLPEEANRIISKHLKGDAPEGDKPEGDKPTSLKDYFGGKPKTPPAKTG